MSETLNVQDDRGLRELVDRLVGEPRLAVDSEFLTERTYYPRLCLIQIGAPRVLATVDPLECADLSPLAELFSDPVEMIVHAGSQDLAILKRRLGIVPERVFDTQIGAAFLGFGHSIGYARLVEACCGVRLKRSQAYTDWSRRPLEPQQLEYALDDVRYLLTIHDTFTRKLEGRDRLGWADQEFERARATAISEIEPQERWRRVSGARINNRREVGILRELAAWREEEAQRRDKPRQRIVPDRVLTEIARRKPQRAADLNSVRGLHPNERQRSADAIVDVVRRALELPDDELPEVRRQRRSDDDPKIAVAATLADAFLKTRTRELDLAPQLLANRKDLERLVRRVLDGENENRPTEPPLPILEGWRRDVAGDDILRLLAGQFSLRVVVKQGSVRLLVDELKD